MVVNSKSYVVDLDDDEPYGTTLMPSPDPYDRSQRVIDLNRELMRTQTQDHKASKVSFHEESNHYYSDDDYILNISKRRIRHSDIGGITLF